MNATPERTILHADLDAFFASVEQRDDPSLRGRPVLVGGAGPRGVVCAASYEARPFGCRSAMPMATARRLCPHAIIVPVRFERYHEASDQVFEIFQRFTPLIQPLSLDEAFLDVTGSRRLFGAGPEIAERIRDAVRREVGLTVSVGVAPNKFLAKLASDLHKPDGLTVIDERWIAQELPHMPIGRMWGVGPAFEEKLRRRGIRVFADLASAPSGSLERLAGADAERLRRLARGEDDRAVVTDRRAKSVGQERTFGADLVAPEAVLDVLLHEVASVARRLRRAGLRGRTVSLKIRFGDYRTISRARTMFAPTDRTDLLWQEARAIFEAWAAREFQPVRLIGVAVSQLTDAPEQMELFTQERDGRRRAVDEVADRIAERFGAAALRRGRERWLSGPPGGGRPRERR